MKIEVTQKHINLGIKHTISNTKCPVARAVRAAGLKGVLIGVDWANSKYGTITLPRKVSKAITGMCRGQGMKPFSFTLPKKHVNILNGN